MYAIVDVETTGGKYNEEGITEIAIYKYDGNEIVDQLISLVNPEKPIQPFVQKLTGINNAMLVNAPKFYELAKRIIEITDGCFLVAHNAEFDYRMIRNEFARLGYDFYAQTIDTVRLAQKLLPNQEAYSLGKLVRSLGIPIADRHRASGDALATLKLFRYLLERDTEREILQSVIKSERTNELEPRIFDAIQKCPSAVGMFFFHDKNGQIIHAGKSSNIRKKVNQYFLGKESWNNFLRENTYEVTHERTGSELIADLKLLEFLETTTLKYVHKPRKSQPASWSFKIEDQTIVHTISSRKQNQVAQYFSGASDANKYVRAHFSNLLNFKTQIVINDKIAFENEVVQSEEQDAKLAELEKANLHKRDILVVGQGRTYSERSFIRLKNNELLGYGFFDLNFQIANLDKVEKNTVPLIHAPARVLLIHRFMRRQKFAKTIDLPS